MYWGGCSVVQHLEIVAGRKCDYERLSHFHYRDGGLGPCAAVYVIKDKHAKRGRGSDIAGVIVYTMPAANLTLRNYATGGVFTGFGDKRVQLETVNRNVRCISRVIIEPRYRGLGLASWLVSETMGRLKVGVVESLAVMGNVSGFFERAGMTAHKGGPCLRNVRLTEALGMAGIDEEMFIDPKAVHEKIKALGRKQSNFIERQFDVFLQSFGKRRFMEKSVERTRYVLSRLTYRPVYYVWFNPDEDLRGI